MKIWASKSSTSTEFANSERGNKTYEVTLATIPSYVCPDVRKNKSRVCLDNHLSPWSSQTPLSVTMSPSIITTTTICHYHHHKEYPDPGFDIQLDLENRDEVSLEPKSPGLVTTKTMTQ